MHYNTFDKMKGGASKNKKAERLLQAEKPVGLRVSP